MPAAARINCYGCDEAVAVNLNRSNRAYYHCGHCGLSVVSKRSDSTERMLNTELTKNVAPPPITPITPHVTTKKPTHNANNANNHPKALANPNALPAQSDIYSQNKPMDSQKNPAAICAKNVAKKSNFRTLMDA